MIIVRIMGGLGNQMFQYALGRCLALKNKTILKLDVSEYLNSTLRKYELNVFNIAENIATENEINAIKYKKINPIDGLIRKIKGKTHKKFSKNFVNEKHFHYDSDIVNAANNSYLEGHWQSEKYFLEIQDILRKDFSIKNEISGKNKEYLEKIKTTKSVSLHIRRGDYVSNPHTNSVHGVNLEEYYKKAVNLMCERIEKPHFYIFSDEPQWVKTSFVKDFTSEYTVIDCNTNDNGFEDLRLMYNCNHNIIANSSFSWWGAWLNDNNQKIVIAPQKWFNTPEFNTIDLIPESWIKV